MSCHGHGVVVCCVSEVVPTNICFGVCVCVFFYVSVSSWKIFSKFVHVEDGRALDCGYCILDIGMPALSQDGECQHAVQCTVYYLSLSMMISLR